ncbi:hypothetical protein D3C76_1529220 [compost metagenome]
MVPEQFRNIGLRLVSAFYRLVSKYQAVFLCVEFDAIQVSPDEFLVRVEAMIQNAPRLIHAGGVMADAF